MRPRRSVQQRACGRARRSRNRWRRDVSPAQPRVADVRGEQRIERVDLALDLAEPVELAAYILGREKDAGEDEQPDAGQSAGHEVGQLLRGERLPRDAVPP